MLVQRDVLVGALLDMLHNSFHLQIDSFSLTPSPCGRGELLNIGFE